MPRHRHTLPDSTDHTETERHDQEPDISGDIPAHVDICIRYVMRAVGENDLPRDAVSVYEAQSLRSSRPHYIVRYAIRVGDDTYGFEISTHEHLPSSDIEHTVERSVDRLIHEIPSVEPILIRPA